jgi:hypothetical protein
LLVRRNQRTGELAFYRCWMPHPVPLATLVRVAGRRWTIETALAELKTTQRGPKQVLRSKSPELVAQEVWAHLLVHYALRAVMHTAALAEDLDPDRLSFIRTLRSSACRRVRCSSKRSVSHARSSIRSHSGHIPPSRGVNQ